MTTRSSFFTRLYERVLLWSKHPKAPWYLAGLSFSESSFFPIPPDVMLAPMVLAKPNYAWRFALITTIASVCGGMFGYLIGSFSFDIIEPWILKMGYAERFQNAQLWFEQWGVWVVFIAGFSPIPYKVFTIAAGVAAMAFIPFVLASMVGRGARFFLVAGLIYFGGEKMEKFFHRYIDRIGWALLGVLVLLYLYMQIR